MKTRVCVCAAHSLSLSCLNTHAAERSTKWLEVQALLHTYSSFTIIFMSVSSSFHIHTFNYRNWSRPFRNSAGDDSQRLPHALRTVITYKCVIRNAVKQITISDQ